MTTPNPTVNIQGQGAVNADQFNGFVQTCTNVAMAKSIVGLSNMVLYIQGYLVAQDGGAGSFYWNATSTANDDGGISVIKPTSGSFSGRWLRLPVGNNVSAITYIVDAGASAINTGIVGQLYIPVTCVIGSVTLLADQTGSVVVDIWKTPFASYPPTVLNTITAAALPTITAGTSYQDTTLTGWTTLINAKDTLMFNINSSGGIHRLTITLAITKN